VWLASGKAGRRAEKKFQGPIVTNDQKFLITWVIRSLITTNKSNRSISGCPGLERLNGLLTTF
jgi:hypothetical protein